MIKKLAQLGLVEHTPYRGVRLTPTGELLALELLRHHRLLELYLANVFGFGIDAVHAEADRLEHVLSEALEARIDASLGSPTHDPHGDPIPDGTLKVAPARLRPLTTLQVGDEANVARIPDGDADLLRYLADIKLVPGQPVKLVHAAPFDGPLTVLVGGRRVAIANELAARIGVSI
jgi:DtxR family Mn-dependent transcriptional regulator